MVSFNWFKELGMAGKISLVLAGGAVLSASAFGLYTLYNGFVEQAKHRSEESDEEGVIPEKRILVLGLDGAGKSVFLSALSQPDADRRASTSPTEGFNVVCLTTDGLNLNIWEIGGSEKYRSYWPNFINDTHLLVYVVDSSDPDRFTESKDILKNLLREEKLQGVPILLLGSKQDLPTARQMSEIVSVLGINEDWASGRESGSVGINVMDDGKTTGLELARQLVLNLCK